jgi:hypothetical protein
MFYFPAINFPKCKASDPRLNSCLATVFDNIYWYAKDVKRAPNLFSLELLGGNELPFDMSLQGVNIKGKFGNTTFRGLEKVRVVAVKNNLQVSLSRKMVILFSIILIFPRHSDSI